MIAEITTSAIVCYGAATTRATSDAAQYVDKQIEIGRRHLRDSFSLAFPRKAILNDLYTLTGECNVPNWDGQGAVAVSAETYRNAYRFLEALPLGAPTPTLGAEPDGHITLEWHQSRRRTLSVSISPGGDLHYAALRGPSRTYGTEPFLGEVPRVILDLIAQMTAA